MGEARRTEILEKFLLSGIELSGPEGNQPFAGIFGDLYVANRLPKFSANFNYPPDSRDTSDETLNGGTIGLDGNLLTISSGTDVAGFAAIQTNEYLRYAAGRDAEAMFTAIFTKGTNGDNYIRAGLFDDIDGIYISVENGVFSTTVRKDILNIVVSQNNFSLDKLDGTGQSRFNLDITKMNIFRITYGYLGIAPILFQVYGGHRTGWITFHVHDVVNSQTGTHIGMPYLPLRAEVRNQGNDTDVKIQIGSIYAGVIDGAGAVDASSREFSKETTLIGAVAGTNVRIIVFHNKSTFAGINNKISDLLLKVGLGVESNKTVKVSLYKLAVPPIGGTWADIDTVNSNMEISLDATIDLTGAGLLDAWPLAKSDSISIDAKDLNYLLNPNEYAAFTYSTTSPSTDLEFVNRWSELI